MALGLGSNHDVPKRAQTKRRKVHLESDDISLQDSVARGMMCIRLGWLETKTLAQDHLKAAIHPADLSGRPQRLVRDRNPRYYDIIKSFEQRTGVGGLLNTSFNLHGLPIAMTPKDAFHVFDNSGLDAMLLEGTLVVKKGVLKK